MDCIYRARNRKTDITVLVKVKKEITHGKMNIDANIGIGYFFNDDMHKKRFLPIYDTYKQGMGGQTAMINTSKIEWISTGEISDPLRDCVMPGGYNPVKVTVKLEDNVFVGDLNLGYYKRVSDRLNDDSTHFIPLLNVEYRGISRTIFINVEEIVSVTDEVEYEPHQNQAIETGYTGEPQKQDSSKVYRITEQASIDTEALPSRQRTYGLNDFVLKRN